MLDKETAPANSPLAHRISRPQDFVSDRDTYIARLGFDSVGPGQRLGHDRNGPCAWIGPAPAPLRCCNKARALLGLVRARPMAQKRSASSTTIQRSTLLGHAGEKLGHEGLGPKRILGHKSASPDLN